jgi:hypothetical protein
MISIIPRLRKLYSKILLREFFKYTDKVIIPRPNIQDELTAEIKEEFSHLDFEYEYQCGRYRIDLYCGTKKVAIEIDENGHSDRSIVYELER